MPDEKELVNMTPEEIAAAAEAEVAKNEDASKVVEEEKKPIVEASQPNLEEIVAKLAEVMKPGMTDAQREEQIKKVEAESGFDRKQLGWMTSQLTRTSITSNLGFAQEVGKSRAEKTLGNYSEVLIGKVEEEMKKLPVEAQANPEAWIQMAYLVKGKLGDSVKPTVKKTIIAGAEDDGGTIKVKGLTTPGNGGGAGGKIPSGKKYDADEQLMINKYFDGKSDEYEKSKVKKSGSTRMIDEASRGTNAADKEYMHLTGGQFA